MALRNKKSKSLALFNGFRENPKKSMLNSVVILVLLLVGVFHMRTAFLAQLAFTNSKHHPTFLHAQTDPDVLANLARDEHMGNANLNAALFLYKRALENFILHVPSWLGLTELYYDQGEEKKAIATLDFVDRISRNNGDTAWTKAILADALDQEDILISNLLWLAENHPNKQREIFALADLNWDDPKLLLSKFGKTYYLNILDYYIRANELIKARIVWQEVVNKKLNDSTNSLAYINYLLKNNEFDLAVNAWTSSFKKDNGLIYNGNFERPLTGSAFGWRINTPNGVSSDQAGYSGGLQVSFDGSDNPTFQLSQTIPLWPGEYEFSSSVETDQLTTDQRPFWQITGYQCDGLNVEDEMVPPTQHPETFIINFTVPDGCKAIQIALKRNKSFFLDNKISGSITVGKLALTPFTEPPPVQAVQTPEQPVEQPAMQEATEQVPTPVEEPAPQNIETNPGTVQETPSAPQRAEPEPPAPTEMQEAAEPTAHGPPDKETTTEQAAQIQPVDEKKAEIVQRLKPEPMTKAIPNEPSELQARQPTADTIPDPGLSLKTRKRASITINKLIISP